MGPIFVSVAFSPSRLNLEQPEILTPIRVAPPMEPINNTTENQTVREDIQDPTARPIRPLCKESAYLLLSKKIT